jgi:hypothetical protein
VTIVLSSDGVQATEMLLAVLAVGANIVGTVGGETSAHALVLTSTEAGAE